MFPCEKRDYQGRELGEGQARSTTKDEEFHRLVPGAMSRRFFSKCSSSSFSNPAGERSFQNKTGTPDTLDAPYECRSGSCHGSSSRCSESISALCAGKGYVNRSSSGRRERNGQIDALADSAATVSRSGRSCPLSPGTTMCSPGRAGRTPVISPTVLPLIGSSGTTDSTT